MPLAAEPVTYDPMAAGFQQNLYETYQSLREHQPLYRHDPGDWWAVSRHEDVQLVLRDWHAFSSRSPDVPHPEGHLAVQDPPRHTELRRLVARVFTPRQLTELISVVREFSERLANQAADSDPFDVTGQFAAQLPGLVFAHMMGIPLDELPEFQRLLTDYVDTLARDVSDDLPRQRVHARLETLVGERRHHPRPDLLTQLVVAEVDGERLTDEEVLGFCFNLVLAANETTTNLIANGVATLYAWPEQLALLQSNPGLLPAAIEEMLRFESPVQALSRTVTHDVELAGGMLPAGAHLRVVYGSANRDGSVFGDADRFDIRRRSSGHLGFGHGIHFCIGAHLARMEAREAFRVLLPMLSGLHAPQGPLAWKRSPWQRSLVELPLSRVDA